RPRGRRRARRPDPPGSCTARAEVERLCLPRDHSEIVRRPGAGHFLHQEQPDEVNGALMRWLSALPR
ncbi:alpha/beta hydrolase, partial [Nonomuraea fuscirosea]